MSDRTFKVQSPLMRGDDVRAWQETLRARMRFWKWENVPLTTDGTYGVVTRSFTSLVLKGLGIEQGEMRHGVTPALRIKVRNPDNRNQAERARAARRQDWRVDMRDHFAAPVSTPMRRITADSWGWHPGIHDGIDLICPPREPLLAMTAGLIVRADASGWWGLGAPKDPALKAKGDGIIILRCKIDRGPFRVGMNLCYGHAEGAKVRVGEHVEAGEVIGEAGLANAWHIHFMVNDNRDERGVGDRDPRPFYDYARKHD